MLIGHIGRFGRIALRIPNESKEAFIVEMRKTVSTREPTRKVPCSKYEQKTCINIENNKLKVGQP